MRFMKIRGNRPCFKNIAGAAFVPARNNILWFTPLEKAADFNRWSLPIEGDGDLKPPPPRTVKEQSSLTGFTLIEMVVAMSIFIVVIGFVYTSLRLNDVCRYNVGIQTALYRQNKRVQDIMAEELRLSAPNKFSLNDSNPDTIRFQTPLPTLDNEYNIKWGADNTEGFYIQYQLAGTDLKSRILNSTFSLISEKIIGSGIDDLQFVSSGCPDNCVINITTEVSKKNILEGGLQVSLNTTSRVYLRNR